MPKKAIKAEGIKTLKEMLGCNYMEKATGVIRSNEEDGVARWIRKKI